MDVETVQRKKEQIVKIFGRWTSDNIHLGGDVYTIDKRLGLHDSRLRRVIQIIADIAKKPISELKILDLGCREGLFAIELARWGANVVAIEGRKNNVERAKFVKDLLSLGNLEIILGDVPHVSKNKYGSFDVILCLGLLYHLDAPDVFKFAENISQMCLSFTVIDTHISLSRNISHTYKGKQYWGRNFFEHSKKSTQEQKIQNLWGSLDNPNSFWLTRSSLYNLLTRVSFTSIYESHCPPEIGKAIDKVTLLAVKGLRRQLISCPLANKLPLDNYSEQQSNLIISTCKRMIIEMLKRIIPPRIKRIIGRFKKGAVGIS